MLALLLKRKLLSAYNTFRFFTPYQWARNGAFAAAGIGLLVGLHFGFLRLLAYLNGVQMIGPFLVWKLTAMMLLTTFSMVVVSSLLTSLSTLYYSFDLKFLLKAPIPMKAVFIDKSLESIFFASWMIGLVMAPYVAALGRVNGYGAGFYAVFFLLMPPYLVLAASFGIAFTLLVLYCFPSARTRDAVYVLSSFSLTLVYALLRFAEPERLIRPDALHVVAEYLQFLQAPTAPYVPSWWLTKALSSYAAGKTREFLAYAALLTAAAAAVYGALIALAGKVYFSGYSGSQEGLMRRLELSVERLPESRWLRGALAPLFWKERKSFFRDVKHWSQIMLVLGLVIVYLFSIKRLPLDTPDLRSLVSFLNIGIAGFVIASLGLRFTYPAISLEGRSWWVIGAAPVSLKSVMRQKFLFSVIPMLLVALALGWTSNILLDADAFTARLSLAALLLVTLALCAMGTGFGALFPLFEVENIHQVESSLGGFVYMACSLAYIGATIMILSWPMQMHFQARFGKVGAWNPPVVACCVVLLALLNAVSFIVPWKMGARALENYEQ